MDALQCLNCEDVPTRDLLLMEKRAGNVGCCRDVRDSWKFEVSWLCCLENPFSVPVFECRSIFFMDGKRLIRNMQSSSSSAWIFFLSLSSII